MANVLAQQALAYLEYYHQPYYHPKRNGVCAGNCSNKAKNGKMIVGIPAKPVVATVTNSPQIERSMPKHKPQAVFDLTPPGYVAPKPKWVEQQSELQRATLELFGH